VAGRDDGRRPRRHEGRGREFTERPLTLEAIERLIWALGPAMSAGTDDRRIAGMVRPALDHLRDRGTQRWRAW
jgi:hypothetical protein